MYLPTLPGDQPFRILIAEDDPAIARFVAINLKKTGFSIFVARDGLEAWNQLPQINPHLILTDIKMPNLSGPALAARVRRASAVPIVMMTAYDTDEAEVEGFKAGADDYLAKPFTPQLLNTRVAASLRRVYRYNGTSAESVATKAPEDEPAPVSSGLPRGFARCDLCNYMGPVWKFESRDSKGNISAICPHCHDKEITFSLG